MVMFMSRTGMFSQLFGAHFLARHSSGALGTPPSVENFSWMAGTRAVIPISLSTSLGLSHGSTNYVVDFFHGQWRLCSRCCLMIVSKGVILFNFSILFNTMVGFIIGINIQQPVFHGKIGKIFLGTAHMISNGCFYFGDIPHQKIFNVFSFQFTHW